MKVKVKLFKIGEISTHNDSVSMEAAINYLQSNNYNGAISKGLMLGGNTHAMRRGVSESTMNDSRCSDAMLLQGNITHKINRLYIEDGYFKADVTIFNDAEEYSDDSKKYISTVLRLINNGILLTLSMVIDADYDKLIDGSEKIVKIHSIKGFDWTLDPSFPSAGIETLLS